MFKYISPTTLFHRFTVSLYISHHMACRNGTLDTANELNIDDPFIDQTNGIHYELKHTHMDMKLV